MYDFLVTCSFFQQSLLVVGGFFVLLGTYYLSKSVFLTVIARQYWLRDRYGLDLKWKTAGMIFGINEQNWTKVFTSDDQLTPEEIKKVRDSFAPIKGFLFITIGTILQLFVGLLS